MSHVLPNISRGRFFEPIFTSKKFDLYTSIYGTCNYIICAEEITLGGGLLPHVLGGGVLLGS